MRPKASAELQGPLWKQLEHTLLRDIQGGRFDDAGRLPSEHELAERFGVNRHTARQAIAGLVQRGIVFKRKGGGGGKQQRGPRSFVGPMDHSYRAVNGNFADTPPSTIESHNGNYQSRSKSDEKQC